MKKMIIILSIMIALCLHVVYADPNNVTVDSFKVLVAGVDNRNVDWDSDSFSALPNTDLAVTIKFLNDNVFDVEVKINADLDLVTAIPRDKTITVPAQSYKSWVFEYFVPDSTIQSTYDYNLKFVITSNNESFTNFTLRKTYEVDITVPEIKQDDLLRNLTRSLIDEKNKTNILSSSLQTTLSNFSDTNKQLQECLSDKSLYAAQYNISSEFKQKYETECVTSSTQKERADRCEESKKAMFDENTVKLRENSARLEQKQQDNNFLILIALGAIVAWQVWKRKKVVGGQGEGKPITRTWR